MKYLRVLGVLITAGLASSCDSIPSKNADVPTYANQPLECEAGALKALSDALRSFEVEQELAVSIGTEIPSYESWLLGLSSISLDEASGLVQKHLEVVDAELGALGKVENFVEQCEIADVERLGLAELTRIKRGDFIDFRRHLGSLSKHLAFAKSDATQWHEIKAHFMAQLTVKSSGVEASIERWAYYPGNDGDQLIVQLQLQALDEPVVLYPRRALDDKVVAPAIVVSGGHTSQARVTLPKEYKLRGRTLSPGESLRFTAVFDDVDLDRERLVVSLGSDILTDENDVKFELSSDFFSQDGLYHAEISNRIAFRSGE